LAVDRARPSSPAPRRGGPPESRRSAGDAGFAPGLGNKRADLTVLFGLSQVGIAEDDSPGGLAAHLRPQAGVWFGPVGVFGEVINRELFFGTRARGRFRCEAALRL